MDPEDTSSLNSAVEKLSVSGEAHPAEGGKGRSSGLRREKQVQGGVNESGEWQEPRTRNEHDNRFNFPNRTFSRGSNRGRDNRGSRGSDRDNWGRDGYRGDRGDRGDNRDNRGRWGHDDRRGRPQEVREERAPAKPLTESDKNYQEQQRARAEQRRIKTQMMLERQKEYIAKQKAGGDSVVERADGEGEDDEIKDEGDVWGHDGWDKIMHSSNPKRRNRQERPNDSRREEASHYVNPHLRSLPKQEEWQKDQVNKTQVRAQEQEQKKVEEEARAKERAEKKQFVRPLYVPPGRKAVQAQQEADKARETQPTEEKVNQEVENGTKKDDDEADEDYDEEDDEYEDEGDGEDGEGSSGDVVLIMQVEISPGVSKSLQVRRGDLPQDVATRFCTEHGMNVKFIRILTENIERHLKAQSEEQNT